MNFIGINYVNIGIAPLRLKQYVVGNHPLVQVNTVSYVVLINIALGLTTPPTNLLITATLCKTPVGFVLSLATAMYSAHRPFPTTVLSSAWITLK